MGSHMVKINLVMLPPPSTCRSLWEWDFAWGDLGGRCMLGHETLLESRSPAWHREMCGSDREFWMVTRQCKSSEREVRKSTRRESKEWVFTSVYYGLLLACAPRGWAMFANCLCLSGSSWDMNLCIYSTHSFTKEYILSILSLARPKKTSSKHKGYSTK